ncbi:hypothetical protein SAMN05444411_10173 [Lutibacter oricola]|uniref:STAS domain-containing protein n=1 Tax=Lutibacter oricola TaxID=762486 RepID=A0A1H2QSP7_9FLAO|nr:hypothetical protein [Lutibacter oricola]SDW10197.1 hypothetical protein SAMN05444411_10173 [Lutibacter oricola]
MIINYQTFTEKNLLIIRYEGDFCIDKYKAQVLDIVAKPEWNSIHKILVDLRSVEVEFELEDIQTLVDIKKNIIKKEHLSVQLVDKPMITALSHLLQTEFSNYDLTTEYCSTVNKAIELLDINFNVKDLTNTLENLEHTF